MPSRGRSRWKKRAPDRPDRGGCQQADHWRRWREYTLSRGGYGYGLLIQGIMGRWAVTDELKDRYLQIAADAMASSDITIALSGARILAVAEDQNQRDELKNKSDTLIQNIINMREPEAPDPEYLAWKRQKLMLAQQADAATTKLIEDQSNIPDSNGT